MILIHMDIINGFIFLLDKLNLNKNIHLKLLILYIIILFRKKNILFLNMVCNYISIHNKKIKLMVMDGIWMDIIFNIINLISIKHHLIHIIHSHFKLNLNMIMILYSYVHLYLIAILNLSINSININK